MELIELRATVKSPQSIALPALGISIFSIVTDAVLCPCEYKALPAPTCNGLGSNASRPQCPFERLAS